MTFFFFCFKLNYLVVVELPVFLIEVKQQHKCINNLIVYNLILKDFIDDDY